MVTATGGNILSDSVPATQSVGLVLSGGGAKGIAHIGVIQALEDNDIPIDYITGTSMGAIVGSLYACGFTPAEMLNLIKSDSFAKWSGGKIDEKLTYYFLQDEPLPTMLNLNLGDSDSSPLQSVLPSSLINPLPMNFAFMELYAPYTAQCGGDFNRLFVPFRSVCSDMTNKRPIVSSSGSLGDAVRASMSFPLVFHPIQRNGALLYDGGIFDNFPVDVMRDSFAPQIMIGVNVSTTDPESSSHNNKSHNQSRDMISQLEVMIMQHSDTILPPDQGINIRIHLEEFSLLDFAKAEQIYKIGYDKGISMIDSIKSRIHARVPAEARKLRRDVFKSMTPYLRFDTVTVEGGSAGQNGYVKSLFTNGHTDTISIDKARDAYYRAITPGKFRNLEPTAVYDDSTGLFKLDLKSTLRDNIIFGIGGYLSTSTNSMLFLTGGYKTLSFNSLDLRLNGWIGQSYIAAEASAHIRLLRSTPSSLQLRLVASRSKLFARDRLFFQVSEPNAVITDEYFARLSYAVASGRRGKTEISMNYGRESNSIYLSPLGLNPDGRDILAQNMAVGRINYEYNTLNSAWTPTGGAHYEVNLMGAIGQAFIDDFINQRHTRIHRSWLQADLRAQNYWDLSSHFAFGTEVNIVASTRKLFHEFTASIIDAPNFDPAASYSNIFAADFRANSYGTIGIRPIWKMSSMIQFRGRADMFVPLRPILATADGIAYYGDYLSRIRCFAQIEGVVSLPFANVSLYTHYANIPGHRWNFGLTFGYFLRAPRLLR